jgi:hypothetical protein
MAEWIGLITLFITGVLCGAGLMVLLSDRNKIGVSKRKMMPSISKLDVFEYPESMRPPSPSMQDGTKYSVRPSPVPSDPSKKK